VSALGHPAFQERKEKEEMRKSIVWLSIWLAATVCLGTENARAELHLSSPGRTADFILREIGTNQLLVTVLDEEGNPIAGLGKEDFVIKRDDRVAKILSVEPLLTRKDLGLNIVLVIDNSFSMKERSAVEPLLAALEKLLGIVRPVDNIHVLVFAERGSSLRVGDRDLRIRSFRSSDAEQLRAFLRESLLERWTSGTFLYDAMYAGLEAVRQTLSEGNTFLVVFSDGEDLNSSLKSSDVARASGGMDFPAYAVDYMPKPEPDPFLKSFAESHRGKIWKAGSASELLPIFEEVSTTLFQQYFITYRFLNPPQGTLRVEPESVSIEEVTTLDSSPLLNHVFFETGKADVPDRYSLSSLQSETAAFAEEKLGDTMEKYRHILDVVGRRLKQNPGTEIELMGCNANVGEEKGRIDLSRSRADAVAAYLRYIWGIDPARVGVQARNLPPSPSTNREPEGRSENQRVEIHSSNPEILDTVQSTYVQKTSTATKILIRPQIESEAGIADWTLFLKGDDGALLATAKGKGALPAEYEMELDSLGLDRLASVQQIRLGFEVVDREGEVLKKDSAATITVKFIRREERIARKIGYRVVEKYALILFDFDRAEIKDRNRRILDRITARIKELPTPEIRIVGHTDTIGKEDYNQALSERRAKAVYDALEAAELPGLDIAYAGVGEEDPLYDNELPEGRSLNRTVTITLEYEKVE
jgi:outer membrane protein OmpA-like peptidoglycan-associated protein